MRETAPALGILRALGEVGPSRHDGFKEDTQMAKKKLNKGKKLSSSKSPISVVMTNC